MDRIRESFSTFLFQIVSTIAGFVTTWTIAYFLGAPVQGRYTSIISFLYWAHVPAIAIETALTKRLSEQRNTASLVSSAVLLNLTVLLASLVVLYLFRAPVADLVGVGLGVGWTVLFIGFFTLRLVNATIQGTGRVAFASGIWAGYLVLQALFQVVSILLGNGVEGLLLAQGAAALIAALAGLWATSIPVDRPTSDAVSRLLNYGKYSWITGVESQVFGWMDIFVLTFFVSSSQVGIYGVAWTMASTLAIASNAIKSTLFPNFSRLGAEGELEEIRSVLQEAMIFSPVFLVPGLFGAAIIGDRLLAIYRPIYATGQWVLVILIVARLVNVFSQQFLNTLNALDRPDLGFKVSVAFIGSNVILNVFLVYTIGWYGAAIATALSSLLGAVLSYLVLRSVLQGVSIPLRTLLEEVVAGGVMVAGLLYIVPMVPNRIAWTLGSVGLGALVYFCALLVISRRIRLVARRMVST